MKDYYNILGVAKDASADEIKRSYRALAMRYHPDKNSSVEAEEVFKEITEAYSVLNEPERRKRYDFELFPEGAPVSVAAPRQVG